MQEIEVLLEQVEFVAIAVAVIVLALLALEHKEIVYAAFFFGIMASVVAGVFLLLEAPFIAGMQIAVYTGGISALIIFAVLLLPRAQDSSLEVFESPRRRRLGLATAAGVMTLSGALALLFPWYEAFPAGQPDLAQSLQELAVWMWGTHGVIVQMVALTMLTSIVGTMTLLRMEKTEHLQEIATYTKSAEATDTREEAERQ
ncbi:MAG: NADH-quinone oxidoreductase subunit J [Candidatus Thorarchaeota archaeon]|nr:NADH-quinone oxidoreductase subunit J [Candidatus Thorarchaeota archaeon]